MATQLSPDQRRLLRRALRARFLADGDIKVPLRTRLKAHNEYELFNLIAVFTLVYWWLQELFPGGWSGAITFWDFVVGVAVIQACALQNLILRRCLVFSPGSGGATLHQGRKAFPIALAQPDHATVGRRAVLVLDGGAFYLRPGLFARRSSVHGALSALLDWIRLGQGSAGLQGSPVESRGVGPYLALLDIDEAKHDEIRFRAPICADQGKTLIVLYVACAIGILLLPLLAGTLGRLILKAGDIVSPTIWALSILWAVLFQTFRPRITAVAGKGVCVRTLGKETSSPPWACQFKARHLADTIDLPSYPEIQLVHAGGVCTLVQAMRRSEAELAQYADRMNAFIWGGPTQPHDPANPPPPPDPMFVGRKIFVDD